MKATYYKGTKMLLLVKFKNRLEGKNSYQFKIFETMQKILEDPNVNDFDGLEIELTMDTGYIYLNGNICFKFDSINNAEVLKLDTSLKEYEGMAHDEFLTLGQYCRYEVDKVMTIYDTIDRRRNVAKLFMLGNALTRYNPYFEELGLPNDVVGYHYIKERDMLIHVSNDLEYQKERLQSAITKLAGKNSKYIKMSSETKFVYDDDDYVLEIARVHITDHRFGIMINNKAYTVSKIDDGFYIHNMVKNNKLYHNKRPTRQSILISKKALSQLRSLYLAGQLFYNNIDIKQNFIKEYIKE
jgi:hypothetical protein